MLRGVSLETIDNWLTGANVPVQDKDTILTRLNAYDQVSRDISHLVRGALEQAAYAVRPLRRNVTKQPYLIHLARVVAKGIARDPVPQDIDEWWSAGIIDATRWNHDSGEAPIDVRVRELRGQGLPGPTREQRESWRKRAILLNMQELHEHVRAYLETTGGDEERMLGALRDIGYAHDKVTRERGNVEIEPQTDEYSYWIYTNNLFVPRTFPQSAEFPILAALFNGQKAQTKHGLIAATAKAPDRDDIISEDLFPNPEDIELDRLRQLSKLMRREGDVSEDDRAEYAGRFADYRRAAELSQTDYLESSYGELQVLYDAGRSEELQERLRQHHEEHEWAKNQLNEWGSRLMHGDARTRNMGKTMLLIDHIYNRLDSLADSQTYEARSLKNNVDALTVSFADALAREIMHHRVFHGWTHPQHRKLEQVTWDWAQKQHRLIREYQSKHPEYAFRFTPDVPEQAVKKQFRRIHRFSTRLREIMGAKPSTRRWLSHSKNQYMMVAIMDAFAPYYLVNTELSSDFNTMIRPPV